MLVRIIFLGSKHRNDGDFYNHARGTSMVSKILQKQDTQGFVSIGFVDDDKKDVPFYFHEFDTLEKHPSIDFKKHPQTDDYLIVVKPAMEKFLLGQLQEIGKKPSDFGLPDDFKEFKRILKKVKLEHDPNYKAMIDNLLNSNSSGIAFMIEKIKGLR